ncbi:MAG: bifunctional riboflavin kinase/FAD synthetase [Candidatus Nanopelagicales bacterium]
MPAPASVVTIGVFDGVHLGHRALIDLTVSLARTEGLRSVAVTFDPHPMSVVRGLDIPLLTTAARRRDLLMEQGIEHVHVCHFDLERAQQEPRAFIEEILMQVCGASMVVVGEGFRFGHKAMGDANGLRDAGLIVHEVPAVIAGVDRVSSTRIRGALIEGDVTEARALLGRPHRIEGLVLHGSQRGRTFGYPTANVGVTNGLLVPADGVYAGWLTRGEIAHGFEGETALPAAISIGTNPTFDDVIDRRVEAFVLDTSGLDLYGEYVALDFQARLRAMQKFDGIDSLMAAMAHDVEQTRIALGQV